MKFQPPGFSPAAASKVAHRIPHMRHLVRHSAP